MNDKIVVYKDNEEPEEIKKGMVISISETTEEDITVSINLVNTSGSDLIQMAPVFAQLAAQFGEAGEIYED